MSYLPKAPTPKSPLGRYRLLSPNAAVRVSPICLGAMNFGDAWKADLGPCDKEQSFKMLDFFYEQGGNFIDTSNNYQLGESETWVGEWLASRGVRDQMVIATKYTTNYRAQHSSENTINFQGNGTKSLHLSVAASLKKLQTDYIDLLYLHWWDFSATIPEVMQSLNALVTSGKVLYLGVSDTPAWVVSKANEYARNHGLRQFSVYQGRWSAGSRDFEREIIPMCREERMGILPWGALGEGKFKSEEQRKTAARTSVPTETDIKISQILEKIAKRKNSIITSIAQAYVMHKAPYVFPILGGRKIEHLKANIEALTLSLDEEDMKEIEGAVPFELGFPSGFLYVAGPEDHPGKIWLLAMGGVTDYVNDPAPINPNKPGSAKYLEVTYT
ncbi:aldo/keto reductase [Xylariaceae sp. FL0255]|nr:aldo/keto reductase [Xylariaceae sp. FL0255]